MKRRAALAETQFIRPAKRPRSQLAVTQEIVRRELRRKADWKYCDNSSAGANSTSSGTITSLLAPMSRGDTGLDTFDGNLINPSGITVKYTFNTNQSYNAVRFMVFQWFDSSTPQTSGVLATTTVGLAVLAPVYAANKPLVKVLYDKTHIIAPTAADGGTIYGQGVCYGSVYIPGKRIKPVRFSSQSTAVQDGNIYILQISDDSLTTFPTVHWHSRVTFTD